MPRHSGHAQTSWPAVHATGKVTPPAHPPSWGQATHRRGGRPPTVAWAGHPPSWGQPTHRRGGRPPAWGQATGVGAGQRRGGRPPSWGQATVVGAGHRRGGRPPSWGQATRKGWPYYTRIIRDTP